LADRLCQWKGHTLGPAAGADAGGFEIGIFEENLKLLDRNVEGNPGSTIVEA
jgi:hypothetical protein